MALVKKPHREYLEEQQQASTEWRQKSDRRYWLRLGLGVLLIMAMIFLTNLISERGKEPVSLEFVLYLALPCIVVNVLLLLVVAWPAPRRREVSMYVDGKS